MKVIIAGSRTFIDYDFLVDKCNKALSSQNNIEIVSGGAYGADKLGERYAIDKGYPIKRFIANWEEYGKEVATLEMKKWLNMSML